MEKILAAGLIIREPWCSKILNKEKTWEIRGSRTEKRGRIHIIKSGSGLIVGECTLTDCIQTPAEQFFNQEDKHCIPTGTPIPYRKIYAWILEDAVRYKYPISYKHPQGAVIWVNTEKAVQEYKNTYKGGLKRYQVSMDAYDTTLYVRVWAENKSKAIYQAFTEWRGKELTATADFGTFLKYYFIDAKQIEEE